MNLEFTWSFYYFASPSFRPPVYITTRSGESPVNGTQVCQPAKLNHPPPRVSLSRAIRARKLTSSCTQIRGRAQQTPNSDLICSVPESSANPPHNTDLYSPAGLVCIYLSHGKLSCHRSLPDQSAPTSGTRSRGEPYTLDGTNHVKGGKQIATFYAQISCKAFDYSSCLTDRPAARSTSYSFPPSITSASALIVVPYTHPDTHKP